MKKSIIILLFIIFLLPISTMAYPGQYSWDPLYVETVETPSDKLEKSNKLLDSLITYPQIDTLQQDKNQNTLNRLKSWYGLTDFYTCYNNCGYTDLGNPNTMGLCLIITERCLEIKQIKKENMEECNLKPGFYWDEECLSKNQGCEDKYGQYSYYTGSGFVCDCMTGYEWQGDTCVLKKDKINVENNSFDPDKLCKDNYGQYSFYTNNQGENDSYICDCISEYKWNNNQTTCVEANSQKNFIEQEKKLIVAIDRSLTKRIKGKILLQTEEKGEGWYVNPDNEKKYYLGRPRDAFNIMRNLGLGIKHSELENYLSSKFPSRLSGKILLDVEQNGEAYYINPDNLKGYYLNKPDDAFQVMRDLGLGITNSDIRKIDIGEIS